METMETMETTARTWDGEEQFLRMLADKASSWDDRQGLLRKAEAGKAKNDRDILREQGARRDAEFRAQQARLEAESRDQRRQIAEHKRAQKVKDREALIQRVAAWPKRGRARLRAIVALSAAEMALLLKANSITAKEREKAQLAQETSVLITKAAELLGVRTTDVDRWNTDGRLPSHNVHSRMYGKWLWVRAWMMDDIDYASQHVLAWLTDDLAKKKVRTTPRRQQIEPISDGESRSA